MSNSRIYPLWTCTVDDMINDEVDVNAVAEFAQFKLMQKLRYAVDSVQIKEINLHIIEEGVVYPLVSMDVIMGGENFGITVSMEPDDLIHFVNFNKAFVNAHLAL